MTKEIKKRVAKEVLIFVGLAIVVCVVWLTLEMRQSSCETEIKEIDDDIKLMSSRRDSLALPSYEFLQLRGTSEKREGKPPFDPNKPSTPVGEEVPLWEDTEPLWDMTGIIHVDKDGNAITKEDQKELDSLNNALVNDEKKRIESLDLTEIQLLKLNRSRIYAIQKERVINQYINNLGYTCLIIIAGIYFLRFLFALIIWSIKTLRE
jgi:hypothetical protein